VSISGFDVAIIGGGIAGVTAARHLAPHVSVVLLEQESELAYHTTSRSAALYVENEGGPVNQRLSAASHSFFQDPPWDLDAPLVDPIGFLKVGPDETLEKLAREAEIGREVTKSLELLDANQISDLCPVLRPAQAAVGLWEPGACSIDVMALHQHYLRDARGNGLDVRRSARVEGLTRSSGRWDVDTRAGALTAGSVVNAAGAWGDVVGSMAGAKPIGLTPKRRTAFTSPIGEDPTGWPFIHGSADDATCYFKPEAGQQIMASLVDETPSEPCDARPEEVDVALAIENLNKLTTLHVRSVRTSWAGLRTFAPDRSPVVGWDDSVEGFCWMVGQGGCGIVTSPTAGAWLAAVVLGKTLPARATALGLTSDTLAPRRG